MLSELIACSAGFIAGVWFAVDMLNLEPRRNMKRHNTKQMDLPFAKTNYRGTKTK